MSLKVAIHKASHSHYTVFLFTRQGCYNIFCSSVASYFSHVATNPTRVSYLQTQLQDGSRLTFSCPFSYVSFSSSTFSDAPYRIFLLFLTGLPCHFYCVVTIKSCPSPNKCINVFFFIL